MLIKKKIKDTVHLPKCEVPQSTEKTGISVLRQELDTPNSHTISGYSWPSASWLLIRIQASFFPSRMLVGNNFTFYTPIEMS